MDDETQTGSRRVMSGKPQRRRFRCRIGLHQWCAVPRWWLKHVEEQFGPDALPLTVRASMSPWPGGHYGGYTCDPYCLDCGKNEVA